MSARLCVVLCATVALPAWCAFSVVSNAAPRRDATTGAILDIHDGTTIRGDDGTFYWYGASYGSCVEQPSGCASVKLGACGFNANHSVSLATSKDLVNWTLQGVVLAEADRPVGIMFSPWVARSAETGLYVLWYNMLPIENGAGVFDAAYYSVATSVSPLGPFKTVVVNVTGIAYQRLPDAPAIFVDDDGAGYIAFTHEDSHVNNIQQLSRDLLGPLPGGSVSPQIGGGNIEGALMFKRNGIYYFGGGECCCFCEGGTDATLWMSPHPLGPYTPAGTLATAAVWGAQTGTVWFTGVDYVLFGDRWQSSPDSLKAHDFSYMAPIAFNADGTVNAIASAFQPNVTVRKRQARQIKQCAISNLLFPNSPCHSPHPHPTSPTPFHFPDPLLSQSRVKAARAHVDRSVALTPPAGKGSYCLFERGDYIENNLSLKSHLLGPLRYASSSMPDRGMHTDHSQEKLEFYAASTRRTPADTTQAP